MAYSGKIVGPGGSSKAVKSTPCVSKGPGGVSGSNSTTTGSRGYESGRTQGLRSSYQQTGSANNSKA